MSEIESIIEQGLARGQGALSEYWSKKVLAAAGVPVTREELAGDADQAVALAGEIGFPVALKACSWRLMHKSEAGAVALNLTGADAVRAAYERVAGAADELEGVLVQEMVAGSRELVAGLIRDPQFGACVMVGLGGVLTEVLQDTAFRVAPPGLGEAQDMISELRCAAMLGRFRGQAAVDRQELGRMLIALGDLGLEHPAVAEIDVNPVIADRQGRLKAADALVVLRGGDHA